MATGARFDLMVERGTFGRRSGGGDRVTERLRHLLDHHHPARAKAAVGQPDQHLDREVRERLRKVQQVRSAAMASRTCQARSFGSCGRAASLLVREERRSVGCTKQRHDTVRIKRTKRHGPLGRKIGEIAATAGHLDADEVANPLRSRYCYTCLAVSLRRTRSARCRPLRMAFHATCTALARWARSMR